MEIVIQSVRFTAGTTEGINLTLINIIQFRKKTR